MSRQITIEKVYDELKLIAHRQLNNERQDHTFNTTALVHEAWEKLNNFKGDINDLNHYKALAATSMRQILVNYARDRNRQKRHGKAFFVTIDKADQNTFSSDDLETIDQALEQLKERSERQCKVIEYWFFGGYKQAEIAKILSVSLPTVRKDWQIAKAYLQRALDNTGQTA